MNIDMQSATSLQTDLVDQMYRWQTTMVLQGAKVTSHALYQALDEFNHLKEKLSSPQISQSKLKTLAENQKLTYLEHVPEDLKTFSKIAKDFDVKFSMIEDSTGQAPAMMSFLAKDSDAINACLQRYVTIYEKEYGLDVPDKADIKTIDEKIAEIKQSKTTDHPSTSRQKTITGKQTSKERER